MTKFGAAACGDGSDGGGGAAIGADGSSGCSGGSVTTSDAGTNSVIASSTHQNNGRDTTKVSTFITHFIIVCLSQLDGHTFNPQLFSQHF